MDEKFFNDFDFFWDKINKKENFSFVRYADGEVMLIKGEPVNQNTQAYQVDKWSSTKNNTLIGHDLLETLKVKNDNFYFAISSKTDNLNDYYFLYNTIENKEKITFANLWINANYEKNISNFKNLKQKVVLICNEKCELDKIPFQVLEFIPFPDDCVNFWENNKLEFSKKLLQICQKYNEVLFVVCCGPLSAVIINIMFSQNEKNTYVDFGSSLDIFIHNKITRPYMVKNSIYNQHISKF